jgi:acetyl-CoA carboxylase biotin carboxyl carrier protein
MAVNVQAVVTGVVWKIEKQQGDRVAEGDVIMILESMKMEIPIQAGANSTVQSIAVREGDSVTEGQVVAVLA